MRRRSICNDLSCRPGLLLILRLVFHLDVFFEDFFCDRGSGFTAVAAVLDQYNNRHLWVLDRSVSHEPSMIAIEIGELLALEIRCLHLDNLRSAGFSGNRNDARSRRAAGSTFASHNI